MSDHTLSRREANRVLMGSGLAALLSASGTALGAGQPATAKPGAQPPTGTPPTGPVVSTPPPMKSFLDALIKKGRTRDWTLKVEVHLASYQTDPDTVGENRPNKEYKVIPFDFATAAVVFPVLYGSAGHEVDPSVIEKGGIKGGFYFNDKLQDDEPDFNDQYPCGTRLARWEMKNGKGREADLKIEIPMTCWEVEFDEKGGAKAVWPTDMRWGKVAASSFQPQMGVDPGSSVVTGLLSEWTGGKSPQTIPPLQLAKFLAGKVMEHCQPSGLGLRNADNSAIEGMDLRGASATLAAKLGSEHDIACALCAVYRAAGLPARTVIGWDIKDKKGQDAGPFDKAKGSSKLRSWVEFCLYDQPADRELWVPVDIVRMRGKSSRAPSPDRAWPFVFSHDELDDIMPFAFQYHPPTTVQAHGSPAFWGWLTTPRTQVATQYIRFQSQTTPKRGGQPPKKKSE